MVKDLPESKSHFTKGVAIVGYSYADKYGHMLMGGVDDRSRNTFSLDFITHDGIVTESCSWYDAGQLEIVDTKIHTLRYDV